MKSIYLQSLPESQFPGESPYYLDEDHEVPAFLNKTNYLNIFVGANNSGKSRLLRGIMQQNGILIAAHSTYDEHQEIIGLLNQMIATTVGYSGIGLQLRSRSVHQMLDEMSSHPDKFIQAAGEKYRMIESINLVDHLSSLREELRRCILGIYSTATTEVFDTLVANLHKKLAETCIVCKLIIMHSGATDARGKMSVFALPLVDLIQKVLLWNIHRATPNKIYIPTLRSARSLINAAQKIPRAYLSTVCLDYRIDDKLIEVETGLDLYHKIKRTRNQVREVRRSFEAFEKFLQQNFFHGREFELVAKESDELHEEHLSVYIDGEERDIHLVGDGIQALIILLYPVFMAKKGSYIFIEEPEINMHPGMQRLFINTLLTHEEIVKKDLTFFLTTHSNHLLDTSLENKDKLTIYLVKKTKFENRSKHTVAISYARDINILNNIGVLNSSVFLANCSIWVEGVTDRKYLQQYINCYAKANDLQFYQEDLNYTFIEYAGSNLAHYAFSNGEKSDVSDPQIDDKETIVKLINGLSISNKVMVVADQDRGKERKHESFSSQTNLQFSYLVLPVLEIENLLTSEVLRASLPEVLRISKDVCDDVVIEELGYAEKGLGTYISAQLKKKGVKVSDKFKAQSGTLGTYYKNKLAEAAVKHITWQNMSPQAKAVAKDVYEFISTNNQDIVV